MRYVHCFDQALRADPHLRRDFRHFGLLAELAAIERLTERTPVSQHLRFRRSAQRFERDTYHEDALPTELRGRGLVV